MPPTKNIGPACSRLLAVFLRPGALLAILLCAFVALQTFLPLGSAIKIGVDEDYELSKTTLCLHGYRLFTDIWCDQPPLYVCLLTAIAKHVSPGILAARLLTSFSALVLLASLFFLVRHVNGLFAAVLAATMLIASPGFLELSSSAMQEIPALAPALAALCILLVSPAHRWPLRVVASGAVFGLALQMKPIGIVYAPIALFILFGRRRSSNWRKALIADAALFATATAMSFVLINALTGNPLLIQIQQGWSAHFASARSAEYGSPADHPFDWSVLLKNWDLTVPALLALVLLVRGCRSGTPPPGRNGLPNFGLWTLDSGFCRRAPLLLPILWLSYTLAVFGMHKPWWAYYYVHNAVPLCWCAAAGLAVAFGHVRSRKGWGLAIVLTLFTLSAGLWVGARVWLEAAGIRQSPKLYTCLALKEIERFKPLTRFLFTDQAIYTFHSDIPLPPRLAVLSLKRFWSGDMTNARLIAELEAAKPGLIMVANDTRELVYQDFLDRQYQLVYEDQANRLYANRAIAKKARY